MRFVCRGADCNKNLSTNFNRSKHEKLKNIINKMRDYSPKFHTMTKEKFSIALPSDVQQPTQYKHNILKHLKSCLQVNLNKRRRADYKVCPYCDKEIY